MLGRKVILQFFSDNFLNLLGLISTIFIGRLMGAPALGFIGYSVSVFSLLSTFSDLGFTQAHVKRVSEGGNVKEKLGTFISIKIILVAVYIMLALIYFSIFKSFNAIEGNNKDNLDVFFFFFSYFLLVNISNISSLTFQGLQKTVLSITPSILSRSTKTIFTVIITVYGMGLVWLSFTYLIEGIILFILSYYLLFKSFGKVTPNLIYAKSYLLYAFPIAGMSIVAHLIGNIDKILIKNFWDTKEVGIYFGAQALMSLPQSISSALMILFFPKVSQLISTQDLKSVDAYIHDAVKYLTIIILPIVLISIFFSREILIILLGNEFGQASSILIIAAITSLVISLARPYSNILFALEKGKALLLISVVNLLVLLISDLILIPRLKGAGAALGIFNMWLVSSFIIYYFSKKYFKKVSLPFMPKLILVAVLSSLYLLLFKNMVNISLLPKLLIGSLSFLFSYLALLVFFKVLNKTDYKYAKEIIHLKKAVGYIKEEINKK